MRLSNAYPPSPVTQASARARPRRTLDPGFRRRRSSCIRPLESRPEHLQTHSVAPPDAALPSSQEEHKLFMATARTHGVGDQWGLFASHIPKRVGYQCSAYYRDLIAEAVIIDERFMLTQGGRVVYVG